MNLDRTFWEGRYHNGETGWDLGGPSTPLKEYLDQLTDKDLKILIPGGGRAWEAEYAHRQGFHNVFVIDLTDAPFKDLLSRCPDFPKDHLIVGDFFEHEGQYDRILEQTFFCALDPTLRERYVAHMHTLLQPATADRPGGKLVGVLFNDTLNNDRPPFGGFRADYLPLFSKQFTRVSMEACHNSIAPRTGRELWLFAEKEAAYTPIDCDLYDRYEAAATLNKLVVLKLTDGRSLSGRIVDLFHREKGEWLRLDHGAEVRLDRISKLELDQG
jgi:transcriptional antiterminator Rof (Rho-off)